MEYPDTLKPQSTQRIRLLSSGREVEIPKTTPVFRLWQGKMLERKFTDTFGGKPLLDFGGERVFAEIQIRRIFEHAGWEGRWIDSFGRRFLTAYWPQPIDKPLPKLQKALFDAIQHRTGGSGGCSDVLCWRGDDLIFAEAKWRGHDRIRDSWRRWLKAALDYGVELDSFLIVEWELAV
jgi:hypothetical protein